MTAPLSPMVAGLPVQVVLLADHPNAVACVAEWMHEQWLASWGVSLEGAQRLVDARAQWDALPMTLVALGEDGVALGCVSLVMDDLPDAPGQVPCIAGLFVSHHARRQGLARLLVGAALDQGMVMGLGALSLYAVDQLGFYEHLGWHVVHDAIVAGPDGPVPASFMQMAVAPQGG